MDVLAHGVTVADRGDGFAGRPMTPRRPPYMVISFQLFAAKKLAAFLAATGCDRTPQNVIVPAGDEAKTPVVAARCHRMGQP
jgi:hypothetical protein